MRSTDCLVFRSFVSEIEPNNWISEFQSFFIQAGQPLVLLVRLSMQELNEASWTTKFSGYIVSLLVIFYLQVTKRLPPVKNLGLFENKVFFGILWFVSAFFTASLTTLAGIPMHLDRSSVVLMGWFEYYSKFDFERNIISVFEGTAINKSIRYENKQMLPPNIAR